MRISGCALEQTASGRGERSGRGLSHRLGISSVDRPQSAACVQLSRAPRGVVADLVFPLGSRLNAKAASGFRSGTPCALRGPVVSVGVGQLSSAYKAGFLQGRFSCPSRRLAPMPGRSL
jgi:hypothetical protein